ncbi:MAG: hypothetical protein JF615_13320, partial [Asticcacaulis sp.]|nr:hypothetical protein [Asticcacaulis sp.]
MSKARSLFLGVLIISLGVLTGPVPAAELPAPAEKSWLDPALSPETRAAAAVRAMTQAEKLQLVFGYFSTDANW